MANFKVLNGNCQQHFGAEMNDDEYESPEEYRRQDDESRHVMDDDQTDDRETDYRERWRETK